MGGLWLSRLEVETLMVRGSLNSWLACRWVAIAAIATVSGPARGAPPTAVPSSPSQSTARNHWPVWTWSGGRTPVTPNHLKPAFRPSYGAWETFRIEARLGAQASLYFDLTLVNQEMPWHKLRIHGRLSTGDRHFRWKHVYDRHEWDRGDDETDPASLSIRTPALEVTGTPNAIRVTSRTNEVSLDLELTPIAPPWRPRGGRVSFEQPLGGPSLDTTLLPSMRVTGRYSIGQAPSQTVAGTGYLTHTWSDQPIHTQISQTLDLRAFDGEHTVHVRDLVTSTWYGGLRLPYLLITRGSEIVAECFDFQILARAEDQMVDTQHPNRYTVAETFQIFGQEETSKREIRGVVRKIRLRRRRDYLAGMSEIEANAIAHLAKPVSYDYDVDYVFEIKTEDENGNEAIERVAGRGRYEVNHLNRFNRLAR